MFTSDMVPLKGFPKLGVKLKFTDKLSENVEATDSFKIVLIAQQL